MMDKPTTPDEFAQTMRDIFVKDEYGYYKDKEKAHYEADKLIIMLLNELGYSEGAWVFDEADKWYS